MAATACSPGTDTATFEDWRASLDHVVATERAFARLATDSTVQHAFLVYIDANGLLFRPGPVDGQSWLRQSPMPDDIRLEWQPAWADVSADGSLGFTTGPWRVGRRSDPGTITGAGQYLTLWRQSGDAYRAVLDFGTSNPVPEVEPDLTLASPPDLPRPAMDEVTARESVQIANEDLDAALTGGGTPAWAPYAHETVHWLRDGAQPLTGPAAVPQDAYGKVFASLGSGAAHSGDLAYTWGEWRYATEPDGSPAGHYVRIWRRDSAGQWKVTLDARTGAD